MAAEERKPGSAVRGDLLREFYGFSFFQAVRLLESLSPGAQPLGEATRSRDEAVRFSVRPGFAFPPSEISALRKEDEEGPCRMEVAFLGLIGPSGVLPNWYNEMACERIRRKDSTVPAFFDIFHHRLISLFYLAWKRTRIAVNFREGARDRLSLDLLSFIGLGTEGLVGRTGVSEEDLIFYGGLLSRGIPSAVALEGVVEYVAGTPARVEQFVPRQIPVSPEDQTQLGVANARLGADAMCGNWVWDCQSAFRLHLGPMNFGRFVRFLPTGTLSRSLFSLIRFAGGIQYDCDLRLVLKRTEVPPCVVGDPACPPLLGWSTWVRSPGFEHPEDPVMVLQSPETGWARG